MPTTTTSRGRLLVCLSPLHTKGFLTLALFILAESVTFSNAVSFWSKFQNTQQNGGNFQKNNNNKPPLFFSSRTPSEQQQQQQQTCSASSSSSSLDCCRDCRNCMDASSVARLCRGGHGLHNHGTAAAAAEAVVTSTSTTPYNIPLHAWKVIFQALLTALNVACWLIPLKSKKISQNKLGLSLANAFSGGVFLSLAFGHLIPECVHGFSENYNEATPFLLVLSGYLLIFFVEKVAFDAHDILHEMEHHSHSHDPKKEEVRGGQHKTMSNGSSSVTTSATNGGGSSSSGSGRSALILLGALAVHSILEMMALGLADTFGDCALLTLSISLHQPAESIALLVAFLKSDLTESQIIRYLSVFSCMGPIGVLLGIIVNEYAAPIVDSIMLAVVAGTFVYVGATEVIPEEWEDSTDKWKKFAALMAGIVSIFAVTQYTMTLGH